MDTITHGIAGALIGKAFFDGEDLISLRPATARRVVTIAATVGAMFPDVDTLRDMISKDPLLIMTWHRSMTHSVLTLPFFALALAALTVWAAKRFGVPSPGFAILLLIYAVTLGSHILLDLITSFGTMVWWPLKRTRVSWDLIFIIDFTMTAIVLLPQFTAQLFRSRENFPRRALRMWLSFSFCGALAGWLLTLEGFPPTIPAMLAVIFTMAALFFMPALRGWGFNASVRNWARAGVFGLVAYLGLAVVAHHSALERVGRLAARQQIAVENLGALPLPPSLANWDGLVRTPRGVYEIRLNLLEHLMPRPQDPIEYVYYPDAPPNEMVFVARQLPEVQTYLWFARFPVFRWRKDGTNTIVEFTDLRFFQRRGRSSFTYQVAFDAGRKVIHQGWVK